MSDLALQKWESVIVDWVNCLEISKRIQNINALKSGEFFKALLDILQPELHTSINDFLAVHYPRFDAFTGEHAKGLGEYTNTELTVAASLLLHFMCIYDRRDALIAPLCQKLNGTAQTNIKAFLEHFGDDTTAAQFNDVVRKTLAFESPITSQAGKNLCTPKTVEWNSSGESPFVHHSPLLEYFKTPAAKTAKMQEKDREIRRLQQELQQERDEKEDINIELAEQKSRIQKISSEVREKSITIAQLTTRLTELEELPPSDKPKEVIVIEKLLRQELADAQQYITELQVDHGELHDNRLEMQEKLAKSEETTIMWETRAVQSESKLEEALARYKAQDQEYTCLQANYNELSSLLEDLRQSNTNTCHLDMDTSTTQVVAIEPMPPEENLASTVVEIQLKECQMEMQELQNRLSDQMQQTDTSNHKLAEAMQELVEFRRNFANLEALKHDVDVTLDKYILTNEKLETKLNHLAKESSEMCDNNKKLEQALAASVECSQKLEDELLDVKTRLNDANTNCQQLELKNIEFLEQLTLLQNSEESLMSTNEKIVADIERLNGKNVAKDEELKTLKMNLLNRDQTIEKQEEIMLTLNRDLEKTEEARKEFEERLKEKNRIYSQLEEESKVLQQQYEEAVEAYNQTDFKFITLQKQLKENDNKFQVSLDNLDRILTGAVQSSEVEKWERIEALLELLGNKQMTFESTIENLKQLNRDLEERCEFMSKNSVVQQDNHKKVQLLLEESQERVRKFENEIQQKIVRISELETTINDMRISISQLESFKIELQGGLNEAKEDNCKLNETISNLNMTKAKLDVQLEENNQELCNVKLLCQEKESEVKNLEENVTNLQNSILNLENSVTNYQTSVTHLQSSVKNLQGTKETLEGELETNKTIAEGHLQQIQELEASFEESQLEVQALESDNCSLKAELDTLQAANSCLTKQQEELQRIHLDLTSRLEELSQKCQLIESQNTIMAEKEKEYIEKGKDYIEKERQYVEQERKYAEKEREFVEKENNLTNNISDLQENNLKLLEDISKLDAERLSLEKLNSEVTNRLDELLIKYKSIEDLRGKDSEILSGLQKENAQLVENVNGVKAEKNHLEKENGALKNNICCLETKHNNLETSHNDLQTKHNDLGTKHCDLQTKHSDLQTQHCNLQTKQSDLVKRCELLETTEEESIKEIKALNSDVEGLKNDNSLIKAEKSQLKAEKECLEQETKHRFGVLKRVEEEKALICEEYKELKRKHAEITEKLVHIGKEKQQLENESSERISSLKNDVVDLKNNIAELENNVVELENDKLSLKANINDLEQCNNSWKVQHEDLQTKHGEILMKCDLIQTEKQRLTEETTGKISALTSNIHNLQQENVKLATSLGEIELSYSTAEIQHHSFEKSAAEEISTLKTENSFLKSNVSDLQSSSDSWKTQHSELYAKHIEVTKKCDTIDSEKQSLENKNSSLYESLQDVELKNSELKQEIQRLSDKNNRLVSTKETLAEEKSKEIDGLYIDINDLQAEKASLVTRVNDLQLSNDNWAKEHDNLQGANIGLSKRIEELLKKIEHLIAEKKVSTLETNELKDVNVGLQNDVETLKQANAHWGEQHAAMQEINVDLHKQIEELVEKCRAIEKDRQVYEKQSNDQLNTLNDNISSLQSELSCVYEESSLNKTTIGELLLEIDSQLGKLRDKDVTLSMLKDEYMSKDLKHQKMINGLNSDISKLVEVKTKLETDLQLVKDESDMKILELGDLKKSKAQMEKELNMKLEQHEKKSDLMQLTMNNLKAKIGELEGEKLRLSTELEEETRRLIAITAEKGKLSGEHNQTMNELASMKQQLYANEVECARKDDIIDEKNQELFALKLDIEVKTSELLSCKTKIEELDNEKSLAIKAAHSSKEDLKKLNSQHKNTLQELKAITDMKNSLSMKMDLFKENMQAIFAHFEIKKKNMKQSLEELKKFKTNKEVELNAVNTELNEVRSVLERSKEENHSALQELLQRVEYKTQEVKKLEQDVEALRTAESGYLQEIGMLKDELNYTLDKFSEALTNEKEQKAESELQIRNLTENLHDVIGKYNGLMKEHDELLVAMEYNRKAMEEIKIDKDSLELRIVQLKHEYDDDAKNCKAEFVTELNTLKKIEKSLKVEVLDLKTMLEKSTEESSTLSRELQDAKSQLYIIQNERAKLVNKMDELDLNKIGLKKEYDNLKIAHEIYMKETKAALIGKQDELKESKKVFENIIVQKDKEIARLKKDVTKCNERIKREEEVHKRDSDQRQKEIQELHTSIGNFLSNIDKLAREKDGLSKKIQQQEKYIQTMVECDEKKEATILMHEKQLQNLQISHDVLEAGKIKMEKIQSDLHDRLAVQEKQAKMEKQKFEASRSALQAQVEKMQAQLHESEQLVKIKIAELEVANEECESVQSILTNMSKKMEASSRQLAVIHEDYEGKLRHERGLFGELKEQHETTTKEMEYMRSLTTGLRGELEDVQRERTVAEQAIHEREETIAELQRKYDAVVNQVGAKDATIASLQAELAVGVERLAHAAGARHAVEDEHRRAAAQLALLEAQKAEAMETHARTLGAVESNLLRTEREVGAVLARLEEVRAERDDVDALLAAEREAKAFVERRAVDLEAQVLEAGSVKAKLVATIRRMAALIHGQDGAKDEEELDDIISRTEQQIIVVFGKLRELGSIKEVAERDKDNAQKIIEHMEKCNQQLILEKEKLLEEFEKLHEEKAAMTEEKSEDYNNYQQLLAQNDLLREQHQASILLEQKLGQLQTTNLKQAQHYNGLQQKLQDILKNIENLVNDRNQVEQIVCNLRDQYSTMQIKSAHITETCHKLHFEQKAALEVIIDDIWKQFRRLSKMIYNLNIKCHRATDKSVTAILENKCIDWVTLFDDLSTEEITEKLEDLKDNASNTLLQLETFVSTIDVIPASDEKSRVLKENQPPVKSVPKEEEWRKKYLSVKQKLTLVENAKNNFEKKIKQLRDENKKLTVDTKPVKFEVKQEVEVKQDVEEKVVMLPDSDEHYKKLLQDYIQLKEDHDNALSVWKDKYEKLEGEFSKSTSKTSLQSDLQTIEDLQSELTALRVNYREVKIALSKLQLDYSALEQLLSERNEQLSAMSFSKESYSNIGEENTKLKAEIDTLKYKRQRDRDKFLQHIEKEEAELAKRMQAVRAEYDLKLDKMKEKIVCKYKEQVDQNESQRYEKIIALKKENEHYKSTVQTLKEELGKIQARNELLASEKQLVMQDLKVAKGRETGDYDFKEPATLSRRGSSHSLHSEVRAAYVEERRSTFSLPRNASQGQMGVIEEVHYRRMSNVAPVNSDAMEMEDEGEMFNNKYLHDLKAGRPSIATGRESSSSRLSEFAYRNSLCPPHLKSSYPAETQFLVDHRFKEDDLKTGNLDFMDDNIRTQLLPSEKHKKKDAGTTSYKRPGPPTPSKHGGRPSLQGNERIPLRENGDAKRPTGNPLRSLFSSSNKKVANADSAINTVASIINGENAGTTSPKKRPSLSFFRR